MNNEQWTKHNEQNIAIMCQLWFQVGVQCLLTSVSSSKFADITLSFPSFSFFYLPLTIQSCCRNSASVKFTPRLWWPWLWMWAMTSFEMWCFFGNMKGCLTSQGRFDISNLPPLRKIPLLSTNGDNLYSSLLLETLPPPLKVVTSSEKRSVWVSGTQYHSVLLISSGSRTFLACRFVCFLSPGVSDVSLSYFWKGISRSRL